MAEAKKIGYTVTVERHDMYLYDEALTEYSRQLQRRRNKETDKAIADILDKKLDRLQYLVRYLSQVEMDI